MNGSIKQSLSNYKSIAIVGFAREGISTLHFLQKHGVENSKITILDKNKNCIVPLGINAILGENYCVNLASYDLIFKAPGITKTLIEGSISALYETLPFTTQTEFFLQHYSGTIVGVTGTKGKTTCCAMLYETIKNAGVDVLLGGNIGNPILDQIDFDNPPEIVVYELSSFMLESIAESDYTLTIGLFTTFYHTHEKEHGTIDAYKEAKRTLVEHATTKIIGSQAAEAYGITDTAIDDPNLIIFGNYGTIQFDQSAIFIDNNTYLDISKFQLPGDHNKYNLCGIAGVIDQLEKRGYSGLQQSLQEITNSFKGVEHRIEFVGTAHDIDWYNDAIATTPEATCAAIESFKEKIGCLFYGGIEGPYNHALVIDLIKKYSINTLILFPDTGHHIKAAFSDDDEMVIFETRSMQEAVEFAAQHTPKNTIALLSCGSPSFSCRSGFVEKGTLFKKAVKGLKKQ